MNTPSTNWIEWLVVLAAAAQVERQRADSLTVRVAELERELQIRDERIEDLGYHINEINDCRC